MLRWTDAHDIGAGEWLNPKDIRAGCEIVTVGLLVRKTKRHYIVTHSIADGSDCRGAFAIPRQNVVEYRRLTPSTKES